MIVFFLANLKEKEIYIHDCAGSVFKVINSLFKKSGSNVIIFLCFDILVVLTHSQSS